MHDELIYFSQGKAESLIASNPSLSSRFQVDKLKFDVSAKIISSSAELSRPDQYHLASAAVSTVEEIFSVGGCVNIEDYGSSMVPPLPGALFRFDRPMAFGRAYHDAGGTVEAGYFVDAGNFTGKCRLLMLGSIESFLWSNDLDGNANRSGSGTDAIWKWWGSGMSDSVNPLHDHGIDQSYHHIYEDVARMMMQGSRRGLAHVAGYARILDTPYREVEPQYGQMVVATPFLVRYNTPSNPSGVTTADRFECLNLWQRLKVALKRERIREL